MTCLVSDDSLIDRTPLDADRVTELLECQGVFYEQTEGVASPVSQMPLLAQLEQIKNGYLL